MAHNKLYRNFIILQEDERGYSHTNDKALSGYAKIEAKGDKCKVSFYAQNLRKEDNYSMVLICSKRDLKQLIDIGSLAVNEVGKGDTSKEYYINNIAGLGISYEKISGAAICRVRDNENEFVMHGFMNGEDSVDNWRKYKFIKADYKKYINKFDAEPLKKDISNSDMTNKKVIAQSSNTEISSIKTSELQNELIDRKKDEKENIELEKLNSIDSKLEDKLNYANITDTKDILNDDRKKCGESKKDEKHEKHEKCDKCEKHDNYEKEDNIEEIIDKLSGKLESYDDIADIKINNNMHEDIIVYGFIKCKNVYGCKWKSFKLEKKCNAKDQEFGSLQNYKRLEENFNLDKLSDMNSSERLDTIDFDKYENEIQQSKQMNASGVSKTGSGIMGFVPGNIGQTATGTMMGAGPGTMGQTTTGTMMGAGPGTMSQTTTGTMMGASPGTMGQTTTGTMGASPEAMNKITPVTMGTTSSSMGQTCPNVFGKLDLSEAELTNLCNKQQAAPNQVNMNGSIGQYFEKIAEGFVPYFGNLTDINYCKWYKINVNNIEDLSDESNYNQYTLAYYPMLNYYPYISKSGHFLLGYKGNRNGDMKYIIYAIPGSKDKNDQPYGGRTGFVTWTSDDNSGKGYWLMFYDFKNSSIVIPTK